MHSLWFRGGSVSGGSGGSGGGGGGGGGGGRTEPRSRISADDP